MATTIKSSALDFNNIKNNLKIYLANQDEFRDYNFEASGLSNILDVLAYNTHLNALIANFALNESYLNTAQLRSSVISLAEGIGYIPDTDTASQAKLRITFTTSTSPRDNTIDLPAFTKFTTSVDDVAYTFQTIEKYSATDDGTGFYEFRTGQGSNQISVYEGTKRSKTFLVGEYIDNPVYIIPDTKIDADTVTVNVYESASSSVAIAYNNILNAVSISAQSTVYILKEAPNSFFELSFGDGETFGIAPAAGSRIEVSYIATNGSNANGASVFTPAVQLSAGGVVATLNVSTKVNSLGGDTKETIESIRKNAPFQYATQNRMVTAEDYSSLILRNYSTLIKDIVSWGGQDDLYPEFGAVFTSILFEDDVSLETRNATKRAILDLAAQLAIVSFNLRFSDPITTFIEMDIFFQINPNLTDQTLNTVQAAVTTTVNNYFVDKTGKFKQSFRRSNLLTNIDESNAAILSSRANVRMQQRFTPSAPNLIRVINQLALGSISDTQINIIVQYVVSNQYDEAASYMVNNNLTASNFTVVRTTLASVSISNSQQLRFPVNIALPDDNEYIVTSNQFVYNGTTCILRNALSSSIIQIISLASNDVVVDNIGSYNATTGTVTINYFNPSSIGGGETQIKLAVVPANQSAISPTRNDLLVYDTNRSTITPVIVSATN
tara:strand:- start:747 stop:2747 length:2001 start_codon:yes stop_codon:yes gene_type:complete